VVKRIVREEKADRARCIGELQCQLQLTIDHELEILVMRFVLQRNFVFGLRFWKVFVVGEEVGKWNATRMGRRMMK
jgi:hypothetical protein